VDLTKGNESITLGHLQSKIIDISFNNNGRMIAYISTDGTMDVWEITDAIPKIHLSQNLREIQGFNQDWIRFLFIEFNVSSQ